MSSCKLVLVGSCAQEFFAMCTEKGNAHKDVLNFVRKLKVAVLIGELEGLPRVQVISL